MKILPGFVSATIHGSADGVRVANYAQWRRREDFEAMLNNPEATAAYAAHDGNRNVRCSFVRGS